MDDETKHRVGVRIRRLVAKLDLLEYPASRTLQVLVFFSLFGIAAFAVSRMTVPIIHPDEYGYLGLGRWMAGEGVHPILGYDPGLPFVYAVLYVLMPSNLGAYHAALFVNAVMYASTFVVGVRALTPSGERSSRASVLATGASCCCRPLPTTRTSP